MVLLASPWKSSSLSTISFLSSHQRRNALEFPSRRQSTLSLLKTEPNPMHESSSSRQDTLFDNLDLALPNDIYIRNATPKDLKSASYILTKAFFSFNIFTTPFEWLNIYLSLQDNVLETNNQYYMLVAIQRHPSQLKEKESVIGICEVDDRKTVNLDPAPRPYICNLAIGTERRRQGIGKLSSVFVSIKRSMNGRKIFYIFEFDGRIMLRWTCIMGWGMCWKTRSSRMIRFPEKILFS